MNSTDVQIRRAYESESMSPEEIAQDQGLDVVAVKAKLMQISSVYRKDCGAEGETDAARNFSDGELEEVNEIILNVARNAETSDGSVDYKTRLQAAIYVRDDKKGRRDAVKQMAGMGGFNILTFNTAIQMARGKADSMKRAVGLVTQ